MAMLIGAVLLGLGSYYKSYRIIENEKAMIQSNGVKEIEMSEKAKNWTSIYKGYESKYQQQVTYNDEAILMTLNPQECNKGILKYYINNYHKEEYPIIASEDNIEGLVEAYRSIICDDALIEEIAGALGEENTNLNYIGELLVCKISEEEQQQSVVSYEIYGRDEEECQMILEILERYVSNSRKDMVSKFGEHELVELSNQTVLCADEELGEKQREELEMADKYRTSLDKIEGYFTEEELLYLNQDTALIGENEENNAGNNVMNAKATVSLKYILVGMVLGAAFAVVLYSIIYIFDRRLRFGEEIENIWGVKVLGNVIRKKESKKKLFGKIDDCLEKMRYSNMHIFEEQDAIAMVEANIKVAMKNSEQTSVLITGNATGELRKYLFENLSDHIKNNDITIMEGNSILYDAQALENAAAIGNVIFVEEAGASLMGELNDEINACKKNGIAITGVVVAK